MKRALFRNFSQYARNLVVTPPRITRVPSQSLHSLAPLTAPVRARLRFFSSESDSPSENSTPAPTPESAELAPAPKVTDLASTEKNDEAEELAEVEDVSTEELKARIDAYYQGDEKALPTIIQAILARKMTKKHEESDDELLGQLSDAGFDDDETDYEALDSEMSEEVSTDEEIDNLYNARDIVTNRMVKDEYFNMDEKKFDKMVKEGVQAGYLKDTKECEEILEAMLDWEKLLPDEIKEKVKAKLDELGDMCERKELTPEEAHKQLMAFKDELVKDYVSKMEAESPGFDETAEPDNKKDLDDPPGEGPILRWQTRVVFAPGGEAWHPKNRKVKLSVTVKELGLSKHQFRRLREIVGKRYHPGKDELTITSERYEHREENRKDCLRTLFSLIEEAGKANKLAEEARVSYIKNRLRANPAFMARLQAKSTRLRESAALSA